MASRTRRFFLNSISLTLTALIMKGIGMLFSAYVAKNAGSEAMGLYSLLGSVYAFSITLATAGINLGTTRLVSDALGVGDELLARRSVKRALLVCSATGIFATLLLYSLSPTLARGLLGDSRAIRPLRILALSLAPIAICSCLSGYFTAVRRVRVNATLQVAAQLFKIGLTVFLLSTRVKKGAEEACVALVLGGAAAEFISLALSYALYRIDILKLKCSCSLEQKSEGILRRLLGITLPVSVSACIRSALSMLQHALIPKGLKASGSSWQNALSSYGALHGMAMPVILFPSAFIQAFAGLMIPEVSECCVQNDTERLKRIGSRSLTLSLFFSIGTAGIMLFFSGELGMQIYNNSETAKYIRIIAPLIPVMYIDSAVDAILKGSGHQVYSMNVNIIDTLTACIFALTLIPRLGIWGYVISIYATEILNTALSLYKMISVCKIKVNVFHSVAMPIVCIIGATNLSNLALRIIPPIWGGACNLTVSILLSLMIYIALLLATKTLGQDEKEFLYASLLSERSYKSRFAVST